MRSYRPGVMAFKRSPRANQETISPERERLMTSLYRTIALATAFLLAACTGTNPVGPGEMHLMEGELRVSLKITPEVLERPGTVIATLTFENLGSRPVELFNGNSCIARVGTYRGRSRIPFSSTSNVCLMVASGWRLEPGTILTREWPMEFGGQRGLPLPAGKYRFVAALNTHPERLERSFRVR